MTRIDFLPTPPDSHRPEQPAKEKGATVYPKFVGKILELVGIAIKHEDDTIGTVYVNKQQVYKDLMSKLSVVDPQEEAEIQKLFEEKTSNLKENHQPPDISRMLDDVIKDYFNKKAG